MSVEEPRTENIADQSRIIMSATGATAITYDLLGVTLQWAGAGTLFIPYEVGMALEMMRYEVEREMVAKGRAEALAAKAAS
jgi:hypothetical protein